MLVSTFYEKSFYYYLCAILLIFSFIAITMAQTVNSKGANLKSETFKSPLHLTLLNENNSFSSLDFDDKKPMSLAIDPNKLGQNQKRLAVTMGMDSNYVPHEATKHFWIAAAELMIIEFIPWAFARWGRAWENPEDNWAKVTPDTWWRNITSGWEYDGDNFETNNFAHPYHGALYFNAGRTNGYDFWESTAWALTGSTLWEFFGETFRPAFNDWIYTGIGGSSLGEVMYRLSSMVTDNRATGSDRVWSEIFGTLINPVRGFNRAITGEMGKNFPNPEWSRPDDFLISFSAGTRSVDLSGIKDLQEKEIQGLFRLKLAYGNKIKAVKPFDHFELNAAVSSAQPHFTELFSSGYLFGWNFEKRKHNLGVSLDLVYSNLLRENYSEEDTTSTGFLYGSTMIHPYLLSIFPIGTKTNFITQIGINGVLMGATPNDYFRDVEGRNYDFGPGVGARIALSIQNGIWNYLNIVFFGNWIWTQTEPGDSRHHIQYIWMDTQYPLTSYFSVGIGLGFYVRNSYYEDLPNQIRPDVNREHYVARLFFRTVLVDL